MATWWNAMRPSMAQPLTPDTVASDPFAQFSAWFEEARAAGVRQPEAMTLATATANGAVSARTVLMRGFDERGITFYTNLESAKAADIADNPRAALVFYWREVERQVRVAGPVRRLETKVVEAYWATRPRGHRVGAWASPQSRVTDADSLAVSVADVEARFAGVDPPLPPFWGGYLVGVDEIEFWQGRPDRLHERVRYRRPGPAVSVPTAGWMRDQLAP
jgi:pyridoxamine 5'-phosphate oxidase